MLVNFFLPVKDEGEILEKNINRIEKFLLNKQYEFSWNIIVVVNGSKDSFCSLAKSLERDNIKVLIISEPGRGQALKKAYKHFPADIFVYMDIDLAVSLEYIDNLIKPLLKNEYDIVIGSRLLPNSITNRSLFRTFISKVYNTISQIILKHKIKDLQCGFKAINKKAFYHLEPLLKDDKWFFDTELVVIGNYLGFRIKEVPVNWEENRYEKRSSKVKVVKDSIKFIKDLFKLKKRLKDIKKTS